MLRRIAAGQLSAADIFAEVTQHYRLFATDHLADHIKPFRMILEVEGRPVLLHCTSGKDRTGFGIALILLLAGCNTETVIYDYTLTNYYRRDVRFMFKKDINPEKIAMMTTARPEYITMAINTLERVHGLPENCPTNTGSNTTERAQLGDAVWVPIGC
jgi:protein-tyrosine phosphatase